jgi:hypothetical protein
MIGFRNFDLPYFVLSYFRFYNETERQMGGNTSRRRYVTLNNYLNIYAYVWIFCALSTFYFSELFFSTSSYASLISLPIIS